MYGIVVDWNGQSVFHNIYIYMCILSLVIILELSINHLWFANANPKP